jgi:RNA polymerase sigma-70 factor (ECF subfamily)
MEALSARVRDAELLAGDAEAFGTFYARHEEFVLSLLVRWGAGGELAADLAAETFARALAGRRSFDEARGEPRGWLCGIARHVLSESRARGRVQDRVRRQLGCERLVLDDEAIARIDALSGGEALAALEELPEDQRRAVAGRILAERRYEDLALALRCSPSVARQRVSRGLRTLRGRLEGTT